MKRLLALEVSAAASVVILIIAFAATRWVSSAQAAGPHIDMYFMAAVARPVSPNDWCTGSYSNPIHSPGRAIDVIGDNYGSLCAGEVTNYAAIRGWGFGSSSHLTLRLYPSGGITQNACDIVRFGMIDVMGGLHGELQYIHNSNTVPSGNSPSLYAGPFPGQQRTRTYGATTQDNDNCGWTTRHVHQGTLVDCMAVNGTFSASHEYIVWDIDRYIHELDFAEGNARYNG